jgi:hypothetical protein
MCEFEAEFEKSFGYVSRVHRGTVHEKTRGKKPHAIVPLRV